MNDLPASPLWQCTGASVRGASHVRANLPNQDAIQWYTEPGSHQSLGLTGTGLPLVLAVSDGHGSPKSFRSQIGAQLAVETAINVIRDFLLSRQASAEDYATVKDLVQAHLPQRLVYAWLNAIKQHWGNHPLSAEQSDCQSLLQGKTDQECEALQRTFQDSPEVAYGATLLTVVVTEWFILYLQLGDGDILCVDARGTVVRPLQRDSRLIANETTSLCTANAWKEFQTRLDWYTQPSAQTFPSLILLATDGYANSYPSEAEFLKIAPDYLAQIRTEGIDQLAQRLPTYLQETSEQGSGDDITVGLIKRLDKSEQDLMALEQRYEQQNVEQKRLGNQQKKTSRALFVALLWLSGISMFTGGNIVSNFWLWNHLHQMDQRLKLLQGQVDTLSQPPQVQPEILPAPAPQPAPIEVVPTPQPMPVQPQ